VFGDAVALTIGVVEKKIAPRGSGFDPEGMDIRSAALAEVEVFERLKINSGAGKNGRKQRKRNDACKRTHMARNQA
jgi:hypothetical protein